MGGPAEACPGGGSKTSGRGRDWRRRWAPPTSGAEGKTKRLVVGSLAASCEKEQPKAAGGQAARQAEKGLLIRLGHVPVVAENSHHHRHHHYYAGDKEADQHQMTSAPPTCSRPARRCRRPPEDELEKRQKKRRRRVAAVSWAPSSLEGPQRAPSGASQAGSRVGGGHEEIEPCRGRCERREHVDRGGQGSPLFGGTRRAEGDVRGVKIRGVQGAASEAARLEPPARATYLADRRKLICCRPLPRSVLVAAASTSVVVVLVLALISLAESPTTATVPRDTFGSISNGTAEPGGPLRLDNLSAPTLGQSDANQPGSGAPAPLTARRGPNLNSNSATIGPTEAARVELAPGAALEPSTAPPSPPPSPPNDGWPVAGPGGVVDRNSDGRLGDAQKRLANSPPGSAGISHLDGRPPSEQAAVEQDNGHVKAANKTAPGCRTAGAHREPMRAIVMVKKIDDSVNMGIRNNMKKLGPSSSFKSEEANTGRFGSVGGEPPPGRRERFSGTNGQVACRENGALSANEACDLLEEASQEPTAASISPTTRRIVANLGNPKRSADTTDSGSEVLAHDVKDNNGALVPGVVSDLDDGDDYGAGGGDGAADDDDESDQVDDESVSEEGADEDSDAGGAGGGVEPTLEDDQDDYNDYGTYIIYESGGPKSADSSNDSAGSTVGASSTNGLQSPLPTPSLSIQKIFFAARSNRRGLSSGSSVSNINHQVPGMEVAAQRMAPPGGSSGGAGRGDDIGSAPGTGEGVDDARRKSLQRDYTKRYSTLNSEFKSSPPTPLSGLKPTIQAPDTVGGTAAIPIVASTNVQTGPKSSSSKATDRPVLLSPNGHNGIELQTTDSAADVMPSSSFAPSRPYSSHFPPVSTPSGTSSGRARRDQYKAELLASALSSISDLAGQSVEKEGARHLAATSADHYNGPPTKQFQSQPLNGTSRPSGHASSYAPGSPSYAAWSSSWVSSSSTSSPSELDDDDVKWLNKMNENGGKLSRSPLDNDDKLAQNQEQRKQKTINGLNVVGPTTEVLGLGNSKLESVDPSARTVTERNNGSGHLPSGSNGERESDSVKDNRLLPSGDDSFFFENAQASSDHQDSGSSNEGAREQLPSVAFSSLSYQESGSSSANSSQIVHSKDDNMSDLFDNHEKHRLNINEVLTHRAAASNESSAQVSPSQHHNVHYWRLIWFILPLGATFGNLLVIMAVYRERSLQSVTNYFIVSLAFADLFVGLVVMPFAVYVLVSSHAWLVGNFGKLYKTWNIHYDYDGGTLSATFH